MGNRTAIEWLERSLKDNLGQIVINQNWQLLEELINEAKEIEKAQINRAAWDGYYQEEMTDIRNYYKLNYYQKDDE